MTCFVVLCDLFSVDFKGVPEMAPNKRDVARCLLMNVKVTEVTVNVNWNYTGCPNRRDLVGAVFIATSGQV